MKTIAITAAAAFLLGVSGTATAWWGDPMGSKRGPFSGDGWGRSQGYGYGYPSYYGYAP